jgi:putative membrane protein
MTTEMSSIPYCGAAPLPADLWQSWNVDLWVIGGLLALLATGLALCGKPDEQRRRRMLYLAVLFLAVAFISPLCALSSALFSARVAHHLLLISAAAPLLAMAFPARGRAPRAVLTLAVLAHVVAVWVWHAPGPYVAALASDVLYWTMELSLLGTAVLAWRALLDTRLPALRAAVGHVSLIGLMGLLGALITFAPLPLYVPHLLVTEPFGLTALEDQQLAGLLMWAPAMLPNLMAALLCLRRSIGPAAEPDTAGA